jgi:hypothetical protein
MATGAPPSSHSPWPCSSELSCYLSSLVRDSLGLGLAHAAGLRANASTSAPECGSPPSCSHCCGAMHMARPHHRSTVAQTLTLASLRTHWSLGQAQASSALPDTAMAPPCTSAIRHGHCRASSNEPLGRPTPPVDAACRDESSGRDRVTGDLVIDKLFIGQTLPLLCADDKWGLANRGT